MRSIANLIAPTYRHTIHHVIFVNVGSVVQYGKTYKIGCTGLDIVRNTTGSRRTGQYPS